MNRRSFLKAIAIGVAAASLPFNKFIPNHIDPILKKEIPFGAKIGEYTDYVNFSALDNIDNSVLETISKQWLSHPI